jgi:hypothetical protein
MKDSGANPRSERIKNERILGQYAEIKVQSILKFNLGPVFISKILRLISSKNSAYQA